MTEQKPTVIVIGDDDTLSGFGTSFWGWYVRGFDANKHCQPGLLGSGERRIGRQMKTAKEIVLPPEMVNSHPYFYICGVTGPSTWQDNFHLACAWEPGRTASKKTYNGFEVTVLGARELEIPDLPIGYAGAPDSFTTCRNWRFGVAMYGLPDDYVPQPADYKQWKSGKKGPKMAKGPLTMKMAKADSRAVALVPKVRREGDEYLVPSSSGRTMHRVNLVAEDSGKPSCTCVHGKFWHWTGARCLHVKSVLIYEANEQELDQVIQGDLV